MFKYFIRQQVWFISSNEVCGSHTEEGLELNGIVLKRMNIQGENTYLLYVKNRGSFSIRERDIKSRFTAPTFQNSPSIL